MDPSVINLAELKKKAGIIDALMKRHFSRKTCEANGFISNCSGNAIRSHSISKQYLKMIASKDSHVYCFDDSIFGMIERGGKAGLKKVGINKASTINMFCIKHDKELFSPIEDEEIVPTEEQCLRLMYRSLMREKYLKESQAIVWNCIFSNMNSQFNPEMLDWALEGSWNALQDADAINANICSAIKNNDTSKLRALRIFFRNKPGFLCAGSFFPEFDYNGFSLWGVHSIIPTRDVLSINLVPLIHRNNNKYEGVAILSWLDNPEQTYCKQFIESMHHIPMSDVSNVLTYIIFEYIENICISPIWWESQKKGLHKALLELHCIQNHSPIQYKDIKIQCDSGNAAEAQLWNGQEWEAFSFL